jgi:hypothetical protein
MQFNKKYPLKVYVIGVIIAWAIVLAADYYLAGAEHMYRAALVCGGFLLGMLGMYIATRIYRS